MARGPVRAIVPQPLLDAPGAGELSDGQLLELFVARRDERAFEALLRRHGPLVLRVSRRVLNDCHAAEDAFQATFLVLARKAGSIAKRDSVGSWLYGTAFRIARKARSSAARRSAREAQAAADVRAEVSPAECDDLRPLLDEELHRLADRDRAPLVLCYLEGKSYSQAARELGWSEGSMSRRLAQARERLRQRLVRRGVILSLAGLSVALASNATAAVSDSLVTETLRGATAVVGGGEGVTFVSPKVLALARTLEREAALLYLKAAATVLLVVGGAWIGLTHPAALPAVPQAATSPFTSAAPEAGEEAPTDVAPEEDGSEEPMDEPETPTEPFVDDGPPPAPLLIKRRNLLDEETLRKQLLQVPELSLDRDGDRQTTRQLAERARKPARDQAEHLLPEVVAKRPDLAGLSLTLGKDCQLEDMHTVRDGARLLREVLGALDDNAHVNEALRLNFRRARVFQEQFGDRVSVRALLQILTAQDTETRRVLGEQLARIDGPESTAGLVRLALFDLSPVVRTEAVRALAKRPLPEARPKLLEGLRHPWPAVADHAAEALAALGDREAVPALQALLSAPDPAEPYYDAEQKTHVRRELVRVNHLRNCMLCHAPSGEPAGLTAPVPVPNKPLPPLTAYYLKDHDGILVRADILYLRQDFSVAQPVEHASPWPTMQRYDYLVRSRPLTSAEQAELSSHRSDSYPQREAVRFALKELTSP